MKFENFEELLKMAIYEAGLTIRQAKLLTKLTYLPKFLSKEKKEVPFKFLANLARKLKISLKLLTKMYSNTYDVSEEEFYLLVQKLENLKKRGR